MIRRVVALGLVGLAALALPAQAKHRKPITKTYTASALPNGVVTEYCHGVPTTHDKHLEPFNALDTGTLKVRMTGFSGDWDLFVMQGDAEFAQLATVGPGDEAVSVKLKKKGAYEILACNLLGTPTAAVTYTFTYTT